MLAKSLYVGLLLVTPSLFAYSIYKCQAEGEALRYQDTPCHTEMQTLSTVVPSETQNLSTQTTRLKKTKKRTQGTAKAPKKATTKKRSPKNSSSMQKQRCLNYAHKHAQLKQELSGALRPKKREKLELSLRNTEEQLALCQSHH